MSKPSNTLYKALQDFPRKRITLEELSRFCTESEHLYEQIKNLVEDGTLTPIGNDMETSGLLLVSVFCNMQRTPLYGCKDTTFFQNSHSL